MPSSSIALDPQQTVASLVLDHSECAAILQKHRIDFCCRGQLSLVSACEERGVDPAQLLGELSDAIATRQGGAGFDARTVSTATLVDFIVSTHHAYLRHALPFIHKLAAKVSRVHGDHNPRLRELDAAVQELVTTLEPHLDHEERVLFPALLSGAPDAALLATELASMQTEHLAVGALLERLRAASEDYKLPEWACNSYRTLFAELEQLEGDTLRHVHLENHALAPRTFAS